MKTTKGIVLSLSGGLFVWLILAIFGVSQATNDFDATLEKAALDSLNFDSEYGFDRLIDAKNWWDQPIEEDEVPVIRGQLLDTVNLKEWSKRANAVSLIQNESNLWPLHPQQKIHLLRPKDSELSSFLDYLSQQMPFQDEFYSEATFSQKIDCEEEEVFVCVLNKETYEDFSNTEKTIEKLQQLAILHPMMIVYLGHQVPEELLKWPVSLLQIPFNDAIAQAIVAQAIVSANDVFLEDGQLLPSQRLGRVPAELVGMNKEKLEEIDQWVERAIRRKVMPGCQVLVAKSGKIVYDKSFGYHTYDKKQAVALEDVYDIASITKAAATTLGVMRLVEEESLELSGRIRDYIPDYKRTSFSYLRVRHLLSHHTGLQGNLPIASFLNQNDLFKEQPSDSFNIALDKDFYIKNGIREQLLAKIKEVKVPRRHFFRYSDVNFILLQQLIEHQTGQSLDQYLRQSIYDPLGLQSLQYLPGLSLRDNQIVPTEKDTRWRGHLVHGEVHDESAVLLGGIAGHAGLFSNTRDLAVLFQMLINDGEYGGQRFLETETIKQFTAKNNYNYRAYGFDRLAGHSKNLQRYGASLQTFGHTGFTGTCVWADPDNDLVFIFLSNRIHPSKRNNKLQKMGLRERLHKIVYQSLERERKSV